MIREGRNLEQLFLRRRGPQTETLLVVEDPAGQRQRETLPWPTQAPERIVERLARHLAYRGDVAGAPHLRVRLEAGGTLTDRPDLADRFRAVLRAEQRRDAGGA